MSVPPPPPPPYAPQPWSSEPPKQRHLLRNGVLGVAVVVVALAVLGFVVGGQKSTPAPAAPPVTGTTSTTAGKTTAASDTTTTTAAEAGTWVMPNEVGKVLQSAQDDIQALTNDAVFFTDSHDATGAGRHQILDRDWQVCSQSIPAGTRFGATAQITFNVVRVDTETCP
jgi:hypothetical protein